MLLQVCLAPQAYQAGRRTYLSKDPTELDGISLPAATRSCTLPLCACARSLTKSELCHRTTHLPAWCVSCKP